MHELTLLYGVADQVGRVVKENDIDHVDAVVLEIGEATAIVPAFMQDGYSVISDDFDFLRGSELIINTVTAVGECRDCGEVYRISENRGVCPSCGSRSKEIIDGADFVIKEIQIREQ